MTSCRVVIIGGGLAGLSTALELVGSSGNKFKSGEIVLLDKQSRLGGNSAKASSGISAPLDENDRALFCQDTIASGRGMNNEKLVSCLVENGEQAIEFLVQFGIDLSTISHLGGHSRARTRRNASGPNVGFAIVSKLIKEVNANEAIQVVTEARVTNLLLDPMRPSLVNGVEYTVGEEATALTADYVVLASGGFSASKQLLEEFAPGLASFPTTNGSWTRGDGVNLGRAAGALLQHPEKVQLHPTGFVDPSDPESPSKILAAEALRGHGGLLVSDRGERFVNELATRDVVSEAVLKLPKQRSFLLLDTVAADLFGAPNVAFYRSKGLLQQVQSATEVGAFIRGRRGEEDPALVEENLKQMLSAYHEAATNNKVPDRLGRTVFASQVGEGGLFNGYVAEVVPVVHYCMGGLMIDEDGRVIGDKGAFLNLFAAGEVSGGVHGHNRLAGNALLESVVFGRTIAQYILNQT